MRFGTAFRVILILICLVFPWMMVFISNNWHYLGLICLYLMIPFIFMWEMGCSDCDCCFLSGYCSKTQKGNFIKQILLFFGYNKEKLNMINNYENTLNHYWNIYKYINNEYKNK